MQIRAFWGRATASNFYHFFQYQKQGAEVQLKIMRVAKPDYQDLEGGLGDLDAVALHFGEEYR